MCGIGEWKVMKAPKRGREWMRKEEREVGGRVQTWSCKFENEPQLQMLFERIAYSHVWHCQFRFQHSPSTNPSCPLLSNILFWVFFFSNNFSFRSPYANHYWTHSICLREQNDYYKVISKNSFHYATYFLLHFNRMRYTIILYTENWEFVIFV